MSEKCVYVQRMQIASFDYLHNSIVSRITYVMSIEYFNYFL